MDIIKLANIIPNHLIFISIIILLYETLPLTIFLQKLIMLPVKTTDIQAIKNHQFFQNFLNDPFPAYLCRGLFLFPNKKGNSVLKKHQINAIDFFGKLVNSSGTLKEFLELGYDLKGQPFIFKSNSATKRYYVYSYKSDQHHFIKIYGQKRKEAKDDYKRIPKKQKNFYALYQMN